MNKDKWLQFESYVTSLLEENHVVGAAVAVSKNKEIVYQKGFGYRDLENKKPVTIDTIFGIASISKSVTALAIVRLEAEGRLSIQDPVTKYLPEFKLKLPEMNEIKIHHLLSHTVGLPPIERYQELNRFQDHLTYLASIDDKPLGRPGQYFSYCNDLYLLLGAIIEKVTGRLFRKYMIEEILAPLNMHRTTYSTEDIMKYSNVTVQYEYNIETERHEIKKWENLGNYEASGGLRSSVRDLINYGNIYIDSAGPEYKMWQPVYEIGRNEFYGYGVRIQRDDNNLQLVKHGGSLPGVASYFGFVPEEKIVVAVLTNTSEGPKEKIWRAAINAALGLPINQEAMNSESTYRATKYEFKKFVGTYEANKKGNKIVIYLENGQLKALINEKKHELKAIDEETLEIEKNGKQIKLFFNNKGEAWALFFNLRMLPRVE